MCANIIIILVSMGVYWTDGAGCRLWTKRDNTRSKGGRFFPYARARCQRECLSTRSCLAVDIGRGVCIVHTDADDLTSANTNTNSTGFTQYILDRNC